MKILKIALFLSLGLFVSCELDLNQSNDSENNASQDSIEKAEVEENKIDKVDKNDRPITQTPPVIKPPPTILPEVKPTPPPPRKPKVKPVEPEFTEELLKAVQNWRKIPNSVFPLQNVSISEEVTFRLVGPGDQLIASTVFPPGKEVTAKAIRGNILEVSPSVESKLKGSISMDKTDFKKCVAFRFEMGKRIIKMREEMKKRQTLAQQTKKTTPKSETKTVKSNSLFEDLPVPGDFGHGKFCVCTECREKRLATTGSMR